MSMLLWVLGAWIALNVAIVAALHFKPLRARRRRLAVHDTPAFARYRRRPILNVVVAAVAERSLPKIY